MQVPDYIETEWESTLPQLQQFVRQSVHSFRHIKQFMDDVFISKSLYQQLAADIAALKNKQEEILQHQETLMFQMSQKVGHIDCLLDQFKNRQHIENQNLTFLINQLGERFEKRLTEKSADMDDRLRYFQQQLDVRQEQLLSLSSQCQIADQSTKELSQMLRDQIANFREQQSSTIADLMSTQKQMQDISQRVTRAKNEIELKLVDIDQNYYVNLINRIMECETQIATQLGRIDHIQNQSVGATSLQEDHTEQLKSLDQRVSNLAAAQCDHGRHFDELTAISKEALGSNEKLRQRIKELQVYVEEQMTAERLHRAEYQTEIDGKINYTLSQLSSVEEELTRKVNYCNDVVTNAALNDKYQLFKQKKYQSDLDKLLEADSLQLGQYKFVHALVIRMQELENIMMQHMAETGAT